VQCVRAIHFIIFSSANRVFFFQALEKQPGSENRFHDVVNVVIDDDHDDDGGEEGEKNLNSFAISHSHRLLFVIFLSYLISRVFHYYFRTNTFTLTHS
jgi:uncharacterized membrane protein YjjP (DUF1212 family)